MNVQDMAGQTLGQYTLRDLLGVGGMGAVYRAHQTTLNRDVAVKVMDPQLSQQPDYVRRFNQEAEMAANLEHHHIIPIYDYGMQRGISYVVMRYLTGGTLAQRVEEFTNRNGMMPSLGEVAEMVNQLSSALDYAHDRGVIHRDIKPSNVMFDNHGRVYLVDFGIAKLLMATQAITATNVVMGTPLFMAPEQWKSAEVQPATDQYALAVMTYLLVAGRVPFEADTPYGLMHKHLNEPPTPPQVFRPDVPGEVATVLERAMEKEPSERFETMTSFAQAFERSIAGYTDEATNFFTAPIKITKQAGPTPSPAQTGGVEPRQKKPFFKRPIVWIAGGLIGAAALVLGVIAAISAIMIMSARNNPSTVDMQPAFTVEGLPPTRTLESPAASVDEGGVENADTEGADEEPVAGLAFPTWTPEAGAVEPAAPPAVAYPLITAANAGQLEMVDWVAPFGSPSGIALSPDGSLLAVATFNVEIYDPANLEAPLYEIETIEGDWPLESLAFSPDGTYLATGGYGSIIRIWDMSKGGVLANSIEGHTDAVYTLAFDPGSTMLASGGRDSSVRIWDVLTGDELFFSTGHGAFVGTVAFSPDGSLLASGGEDGTIRVWDVATGEAVTSISLGGYSVVDVEFSPDASMLAAVDQYDNSVWLYDADTFEPVSALHGHTEGTGGYGVFSLAFNADGTLLATGGGDYTIRLWDTDPASPTFGQQVAVLERHSDWVDGLDFSPDGSLLFSSSSRDGTVRAWGVGG
ncbi:MAG: serine/threonine protein kinase [Anaerolineae bacterium]|nr:serine/threonine protein kinase [Anaerolineae bacterium]